MKKGDRVSILIGYHKGKSGTIIRPFGYGNNKGVMINIDNSKEVWYYQFGFHLQFENKVTIEDL